MHFFPLAVDLIRLRHVLVEHLLRHAHQTGMRHPRAVVPGFHFAQLILPHFFERALIRFRIVLDRNLRRHSAHCVNAALVAGLDQQINVRRQKMHRHGDLRAIRQHEIRPVPQLLNEAENIIPAPAVQPGRVIAQFPQNLMHLERAENRFDQHRRPHRALRHPAIILREHEHIVPQPGFQMRFQLRQIEVRAGPALQQFRRIMEKIEPEIEQPARHRLAIHMEVLLRQMPAARTHQQHRRLLVQLVLLAFGTRETDLAADGVAHVLLSLDQIAAGRGVGVFEIRHEHLRAGVQRVDHHLAIGRTGDLRSAIGQIRRNRRHGPLRFPDARGLRQKIRQCAFVDLLLADLAPLQQPETACIEFPVQFDKERLRFRSQDRGVAERRRDRG